MRKFYIILSVLVLGVIAMAYLYFSNLNIENSANDNSLNIVTASSGIVFTYENDKSFYDILAGQSILDEILGESKSNLLESLRKNLISQNNVASLIDGEKIYVGFLAGENNSVDFVIATQSKLAAADANTFKEIKSATLKTTGNLHQLTFTDSATCFVTTSNKSILVSNSATALKTILAAGAKTNDFADYVRQNNRFNKNTLANVYLDYNKIPSLLKNILNSNLVGELEIFNQQNTYASLSYNFGSDKLLLNGYTELHDIKSYYNLFIKQPEQKVSIDQLFPDKTANYTLFSVSNYETWRKDLARWFEDKKLDQQIEKQFKALNEKYRIDIQQTFPANFQQQFATFQLSSGEKLGIIAVKNGDKLSQLLLDLSTEYAPEIRIFKEKDILYHFFGQPFKNFERPFYTIIDNHFVFANYASSIQVFLNSYNNDQLLSNTENYVHLKDQIANSASICFYINHQNSTAIFSRNLKSPYYKQFKTANGLGNYSAFVHQLSADNGKFMSNLLLLKKHQRVALDSLSN